jgi:hypothetical protein
LKTKGEVERDIKSIGIPHLALYKPGLLLNRFKDNNHRTSDLIKDLFPIVTRIESSDVGLCMLNHAIKSC